MQKVVGGLSIFACITIHGSKRMLFILTKSDILHFIKLMCVQVLLENILAQEEAGQGLFVLDNLD